MNIVLPSAPEEQALQTLSTALDSAGIKHSMNTNGRGTGCLVVPLPHGDGVVFWDDGEFVFAAGPDGTSFRPMGRSTASVIMAVQEVLA